MRRFIPESCENDFPITPIYKDLLAGPVAFRVGSCPKLTLCTDDT